VEPGFTRRLRTLFILCTLFRRAHALLQGLEGFCYLWAAVNSFRGKVMAEFDEEFRDIRKRMDKMVRDFFCQRHLQVPGEGWSPATDIYETEQHLVIIIELAGANPDSLKIVFDGGDLKITGIRESVASFAYTKCHQMEIDFGCFQKNIRVPFDIDRENATSKYKDGLLEITLPKARIADREKIEIIVE